MGKMIKTGARASSNCIVCFEVLKSDHNTENIQIENDSNESTSNNIGDADDGNGIFQIFLSTFDVRIPTSVFNIMDKSRLRFCEQCRNSIIQMNKNISQISLLQKEVLRTKDSVKSTIRKSRMLYLEKEINCVDAHISMVRDLVAGAYVALVPMKRARKRGRPFSVSNPNQTNKTNIHKPSSVHSSTQDKSQQLLQEHASPSFDNSFENPDETQANDAEDDFVTGDHFSDDEPEVLDSTLDPLESQSSISSHANTEKASGSDAATQAADSADDPEEAHEEKSKRCKLKVTTTSEGRRFFRDVEILPTDGGFRCGVCGDKKFFKLQISTVLHIKIHHVPDKDGWFQCESCGKQFLHKSLLEIHQKTHSNEKPHMCDICGRLFKLKATLCGHRKTHGSRPKAFCCEFCGKQFAYVRDCVVHTRTHTKERPFKCDFCPKSFIVRTLLNTHLNKSHPGMVQPDLDDSNK